MQVPKLESYVEILRCPRCSESLDLAGDSLHCVKCVYDFPVEDDIPMLFWPNEWEDGASDVTEEVKDFYEDTPFPSYDDFDTMESLARKAREGIFARILDDQVPSRIRIIECGCGTAQLSNFLSAANREVYATDICVNSLRMGKAFADQNSSANVRFVQQNLFRPVFKPGSFHLVISNGVLHHTSEPKRAFDSIARLVAPGGYILIGLYHKYGRLACDARRIFYRLTGERFKGMDQEMARSDASDARREAWFNDQYRHPHESKHTIGETLGWLEEAGFSFVNSIPSSHLFSPIANDFKIFEANEPAGAIERSLAEMLMTLSGGRDNGFFVMVGRKNP